ncbi:methionine--tRNA ligase [Buchnera aphidicola]|uniref:Methionine--tRNA ligase n=1 Tax=Buchnera aphidicola (Anoecia oenotherae) TaxID=1241833 RepID=A0A4D6XV26_9GAMM|nr:methionine--tRNA ligase [Buchnera aphidicola]QCI19227.1 methionine--tRNA ligase [Buchnera aphidicola (Anoecia oenotherae)]
MKKTKKKILVTCAFPYANGSIHLGHLLEHIQADIWVKYLRMTGHKVWFICADDAHGTPILLKSKELGITPNNLIKKNYIEHKLDFSKFNIKYNLYSSTHSSENLKTVNTIFNILEKKNLIIKKNISQLYDVQNNMFLPDRLVQGDCPSCYKKNQLGDNCESCGATYDAINLKNPISLLSDKKPILKSSNHLFFNIKKYEKKIKKWICSTKLQKSVLNKTEEWFKTGLKNWNISRDAPYFGFLIPNYINKYFYVWLDAPIGYISTFKKLCKKEKKIQFNEFWKKNTSTELYHFIGKDIIYFHTLFWPAILTSISYRKPTNIFVHGYVTLNGKKLSKSKGSAILAKNWIKTFNSDSLRYYYASKSSSTIQDIEINLEDFYKKINTDIVNKIVNLASRSSSFIHKYFQNTLSRNLSDIHTYKKILQYSQLIENLYQKREFGAVTRKIIKCADIANTYFSEKKPWTLLNNKNQLKTLHEICSMSLNLFRIIATWITPITPDLSKKIEKFLLIKLNWKNIKRPLLNHKISSFSTLYNRIHKKDVVNFIKNNKYS